MPVGPVPPLRQVPHAPVAAVCPMRRLKINITHHVDTMPFSPSWPLWIRCPPHSAGISRTHPLSHNAALGVTITSIPAAAQSLFHDFTPYKGGWNHNTGGTSENVLKTGNFLFHRRPQLRHCSRVRRWQYRGIYPAALKRGWQFLCDEHPGQRSSQARTDASAFTCCHQGLWPEMLQSHEVAHQILPCPVPQLMAPRSGPWVSHGDQLPLVTAA